MSIGGGGGGIAKDNINAQVYQYDAPPTTPRDMCGDKVGIRRFGSRLPHTSGQATSQTLVKYCVIQAVRAVY